MIDRDQPEAGKGLEEEPTSSSVQSVEDLYLGRSDILRFPLKMMFLRLKPEELVSSRGAASLGRLDKFSFKPKIL